MGTHTCQLESASRCDGQGVPPRPLPDADKDGHGRRQSEAGGEEGIDAQIGVVSQSRRLDRTEVRHLEACLVAWAERSAGIGRVGRHLSRADVGIGSGGPYGARGRRVGGGTDVGIATYTVGIIAKTRRVKRGVGMPLLKYFSEIPGFRVTS